MNTGSPTSLNKSQALGRKGYTKAQPGRNYLYTKVSIKEPFDILYLTPAMTMIANLEDKSWSLSPEFIYSGVTNVEFRLRFSFLHGDGFSEFGEKINQNKLEMRLRWFF
ncbi:hypothetical protein [Desulfobacula sp.]